MHCMLLQEDGKETEQQLLKLKLELKKMNCSNYTAKEKLQQVHLHVCIVLHYR